MEQEFVNVFMENKKDLMAIYRKGHPDSYDDIVYNVISLLNKADIDYELNPDPDNIHRIDDGDYQGTLLYVIPNSNYQPSIYWCVKVCYGSCSCCDTLQSIKYDGVYDYDKVNRPNEEQINDYITLSLHIVQGLKKI